MTYFDGNWRFNTYLAKLLWKTFPLELHVEQATMIRPRPQESAIIYSGYFDWKRSYNVHVYRKSIAVKLKEKFESLSDVDCMMNSFGEIGRWILYGKFEPC